MLLYFVSSKFRSTRRLIILSFLCVCDKDVIQSKEFIAYKYLVQEAM